MAVVYFSGALLVFTVLYLCEHFFYLFEYWQYFLGVVGVGFQFLRWEENLMAKEQTFS